MKNTTIKTPDQVEAAPDPYALIEQLENVRADEMALFTDALDKIWALTTMLPPDQVEAAQDALKQMWGRQIESNQVVDTAEAARCCDQRIDRLCTRGRPAARYYRRRLSRASDSCRAWRSSNRAAPGRCRL